jgi:hypothetical protein
MNHYSQPTRAALATNKRHAMRLPISAILFCSCLLSGCSYFGYYKREAAVKLFPKNAEEVNFPNSYEKGDHMDGGVTRALAVAMNDFLPPGVTHQSDDKRLAWCLSRWETYDTSVLRFSDNLFFIQFAPVLSRCGIDTIVLDAGAEYAIDGHGRILDIH